MVGFMQNEIAERGSFSAYQTVSIASRFSASVTIISMEGDTLRRTVKPYQVLTVEIDPYFEVVGEGVQRKGIEIFSTRPISVYGFSSKQQTSDGYLALPVSSWGTSYVTANYKLDHYDRQIPDNEMDSIPRRGEFAVIASEDNTVVTVYPSTMTLTKVAKGNAYTKTLRKGDIFQVQDGGSYRGYSDITGSIVTSNKPVGVLSGHVRTAVPYIYNTKDHLIEMLPPRSALGKRYVAVPFGGRQGGDLVRVISTDVGSTTVAFTTASGTVTQPMAAVGTFIDYDMSEVTVISADKPVLVVQYSKAQAADPRNRDTIFTNDVHFDPDLVVLTPQEQFVNAAVFQTLPDTNSSNWWNRGRQFENHYFTIVAERDKFTTLMLNGKPLVLQPGFTSGLVPSMPELQWGTLKVPGGGVYVLTGEALFGGYVYGLGLADSYAWPIGSGLRRNDVPDNDRPTLEATKLCGGYQVLAQDSGDAESGLLRVWLDSSASSNVRFETGVLIRGDEMAIGTLSLVDPSKGGTARVIAEDLAHNLDTLDLKLVSSMLTLSVEEVLIAPAEPDQTYRQLVMIYNAGDEPITIDSLILGRGIPFSFDPYPVRGYVVKPKQQLMLTVYFYSATAKDYNDTIFFWANCERFALPVKARMVVPGISTHDLDFGDVRVGTERCKEIVVRNPGLGTLRLDLAQILGPEFISFDLDFKKPISVPPGDSVRFVVCFRPSDTGSFGGSVTFTSNVDTVTVSHLTGRGIYPQLTLGGFDFGEMQVGDTACAVIPIANIGTDTAHMTGLDLELPDGFTSDKTSLPAVLPPGDTLWVRVCFTPTIDRSYVTGVIGRKSDDLIRDPRNVLTGAGFALTARLDSCDWGRRQLASTNDSLVYIRNTSSHPIDIDRIWLSFGDASDFPVDISRAPATIAPGDSLPVDVSFVPLLPGVRMAMVSAHTSARGKDSVIHGLLTGFALVAMASDELQFDDQPAYACDMRQGQLTIRNDGNMPLTVEGLTVASTPGIVKVNTPITPEMTIPEGEALVVDFVCDFAGYEGITNGTITWAFKEMPAQTFSRSFTVASRRQLYHITAATPKQVSIGDGFELKIAVDSAVWHGIEQKSVTLEILYNPTIAFFDRDRWEKLVADALTAGDQPWIPKSVKIERAGKVVVELVPMRNLGAPLDSVTFLTLPFRGFLGNRQTDTFHVTMTAGPAQCGPPATASVAYRIDSICGLSTRLFELTGDSYVLKQNTPNPFSDVTEISFRLGMDAYTRLEVFGPDGRSMRVLVDRMMSAGEYVVPLVTDGLASGLYYYRLASGPFTAIRTMIIAK